MVTRHQSSDTQTVIVIGGGLAGVSAANTVIQMGGNCILLDKKSFPGGNSVKATSGINASESKTQKNLGIKDTNQQFEIDVATSAYKGETGHAATPIQKVLVGESAPSI